GTLYPERMKTVDDEILDWTIKFMDKAKTDNKPFFVWLNPTRMHIVTHLSDKYEKMRNSENGWSEEEAGMAQIDDVVGSVMKYLKDNGFDDNRIVVFRTDNGTDLFTWPMAAPHHLRSAKGPLWRAVSVFRASYGGPAMCRRIRFKTESFPAWIGFRLSLLLRAIRTLPTSYSKA